MSVKRSRKEMNSLLNDAGRIQNIVGLRVRLARELGQEMITAKALCARLADLGLDWDETTVSKVENDGRGVADFELKALSLALQVSTDWLLDLGEKGAPTRYKKEYA